MGSLDSLLAETARDGRCLLHTGFVQVRGSTGVILSAEIPGEGEGGGEGRFRKKG